LPWNYIDIIVDSRTPGYISDFKCGPGNYPTKEAAARAFHRELNRLYQKYRETAASKNLKNLRNAWDKRRGNVIRSNNVVLAVYEHPAGQAEAYGAMISMLVNHLCKVNRLGILAGHVSFWAIGELLKKYPDIQRLCARLDISH
jgi:hypothetical protein